MPDVKEPTRETRNPCASPMYQFFDDIIQSVDELEQRAIRALQAWQYFIITDFRTAFNRHLNITKKPGLFKTQIQDCIIQP